MNALTADFQQTLSSKNKDILSYVYFKLVTDARSLYKFMFMTSTSFHTVN